jgi:lipooligosaccharide transport system permease protein
MQLHYIFKVWYRNFLVWKRYIGTNLVEATAEPILYFLAIGYGLGSIVGEIDGKPYIAFIAPALIGTSILFGASFENTYGSFTRLEIEKTFHSIALTPVSLAEVVGGEILWGATKGIFSGALMFSLAAALGLIESWMAIFMIPGFIVIAFLFASLAILVTSFARSYDFFTYYITLVVETMFLFSGTFFPLSGLPGWAEKLCWVFPLTPAIFMARHLFAGSVSVDLFLILFWLIALTALLFYWSTKRILKRLIL